LWGVQPTAWPPRSRARPAARRGPIDLFFARMPSKPWGCGSTDLTACPDLRQRSVASARRARRRSSGRCHFALTATVVGEPCPGKGRVLEASLTSPHPVFQLPWDEHAYATGLVDPQRGDLLSEQLLLVQPEAEANIPCGGRALVRYHDVRLNPFEAAGLTSVGGQLDDHMRALKLGLQLLAPCPFPERPGEADGRQDDSGESHDKSSVHSGVATPRPSSETRETQLASSALLRGDWRY
jgi:hypothetical protein